MKSGREKKEDGSWLGKAEWKMEEGKRKRRRKGEGGGILSNERGEGWRYEERRTREEEG